MPPGDDGMRKKDLEMTLQRVRNFEEPDPALEQYMTPATIASDILFDAYSKGDIEGLKVVDLGCGTGMFSIGSFLLGASQVIGFDISESALRVAESNREDLEADVEFRKSDILDVEEGADTVFMNPPFGCQNRNADRAFLDKAMELSECVYSIHMAETLDFVKGYCEKRGRHITYYKIYKYEIPHTFSFHKKTKKTVDVAVVNIR
ncbi:MAG: methyltransferase domain-containing protein [Candidatus Methanomethylophilaceae archaeon]|nr:methyltransferase domain-containing protein [Candidatus Methanomethylophilaceae archaeon]